MAKMSDPDELPLDRGPMIPFKAIGVAAFLIVLVVGVVGWRYVSAGMQRTAGEQFLAANRGKPDIVELPSGLQYKILKEGAGAKPGPSDTVKVHYRGSLVNGTEFDSSFKRGQAAALQLDRVIPGWTEALQLMPVGSKWELYIPPQLGYGARGSPPTIPGHSTLIFEVELVSIGEGSGK